MNKVLFDILTSEKSKFNVTLDSSQNNAVQSAMQTYALRMVDEYRASENKSIKLEAIKLFPALWKGQFRLWLRKRSFLKSCKLAQLQADTDGYKVYVIRSSFIAYKLMSTLDIELNKKVRVFRKDVDAKTLEKTASFTATRKVHPPVLKRK